MNVSAVYSSFLEFARACSGRNDMDGIARFSQTEGQATATVTKAEDGDSVRGIFHWFRDADHQECNNLARSRFRRAVSELFGGEDNIPPSVMTAMKISRFGGGVGESTLGRPLTARRILAVNAAIEQWQNDNLDPDDRVRMAFEAEITRPEPSTDVIACSKYDARNGKLFALEDSAKMMAACLKQAYLIVRPNKLEGTNFLNYINISFDINRLTFFRSLVAVIARKRGLDLDFTRICMIASHADLKSVYNKVQAYALNDADRVNGTDEEKANEFARSYLRRLLDNARQGGCLDNDRMLSPAVPGRS